MRKGQNNPAKKNSKKSCKKIQVEFGKGPAAALRSLAVRTNPRATPVRPKAERAAARRSHKLQSRRDRRHDADARPREARRAQSCGRCRRLRLAPRAVAGSSGQAEGADEGCGGGRRALGILLFFSPRRRVGSHRGSRIKTVDARVGRPGELTRWRPSGGAGRGAGGFAKNRPDCICDTPARSLSSALKSFFDRVRKCDGRGKAPGGGKAGRAAARLRI